MNPMEQFQVKPLIPLHLAGYDISFTNQALIMFAIVAVVVAVPDACGQAAAGWCRPARQSMAELAYEFVANMIHSAAGKAGYRFFPFVFAIFMFVLLSNFFGPDPRRVHRDQPDRRDLRAGACW